MCKYKAIFACKLADMKNQEDWNICIKRHIKAEMIKRGISSEDLSRLLLEKGIIHSRSSIDSKISRGKFSAVFFIQCLFAMNCKSIEISHILECISPYEK